MVEEREPEHRDSINVVRAMVRETQPETELHSILYADFDYNRDKHEEFENQDDYDGRAKSSKKVQPDNNSLDWYKPSKF